MDDCFQPLATEEYYLRLQPLFEGLAQSITRQPKDKGHEEVATCAVGHLQEMSAATLAGPLRSWVLAFATRLQRGTASAQEREALKEMVVRTWWSGTSAAPAFEAALAPVTEALAAG